MTTLNEPLALPDLNYSRIDVFEIVKIVCVRVKKEEELEDVRIKRELIPMRTDIMNTYSWFLFLFTYISFAFFFSICTFC